MDFHLTDLFPRFAPEIEIATAALLVCILLSSLDDFLIDLAYWARRLRCWPMPRPLDLQRTWPPGTREQRIAIAIPAWQEGGVIARMLEHTLRTTEYGSFDIFVGTYPNDPVTIAEVERVASTHARVKRIQLPHHGPTCKADCLNHIVAGVLRHERATGESFSALVMHDCEDLVHPQELRHFAAALPGADMIQLPVFALERKRTGLVAGTYLDEFAEAHSKDMLVRGALGGSIPSAGVGTCLSRAAVLRLWRDSGGRPFRTDSLTEDYELGMRLKRLGMRACFARIELPPSAWDREKRNGAGRVLAVREFFPETFRAAYRQKARWLLGIGLQGWRHTSLRHRGWADAYLLLHDRKGVATAFLPPAGYIVMAYFLMYQAGVAALWWPAYTPRLFQPGSLWSILLYTNAGLLVARAMQRAYFTHALYGSRQALLALPRIVAGNLVNCAAAARAWRLYLVHLITGKPLAWDKTAHEFPDIQALPDARPTGAELAAAASAEAARLIARQREAAATTVRAVQRSSQAS